MRTSLIFVSIQVSATEVDKVYRFDIPSQPLVESLGTLSQTTELLFLFPYDLVETKESKHLYGLYTAQQALDLLLAGTGLQGELSNNQTFMVKPILAPEKNDKSDIKGEKQLKTKKTIIASILAMLFTSAHGAQETDTNNKKKEKEEIEVIEVTTIRQSIISSLNTKRSANSVVDAINADDIGSFPDNNVAESLQRIPGVSITRDLGGEGENISIRGFSPGKNLSLVNGQQLMSSGFQLENSLGRGYNYGLLPAGITQRAEVYKSSEAHLPVGGVGGTVNVITRKPLAQKQQLFTMLSGKVSHNSLADEVDPSLSGLVSWKNEAENFGLLVSLDHSEKTVRRDATEVLRYDNQQVLMPDGTLIADVAVPARLQAASFNRDQKRDTAMVTLQYQPTDSIDMSFNYLSSEINGNGFNIGVLSENKDVKHDAPGVVLDATYDAEHHLITSIDYAELPVGKKNSYKGYTGSASSIYRTTKVESEAYNYDIQWLGENLTLRAAIGASSSSGGAGDRVNTAIALTGRTSVSIEDGVGYAKFHDEDLNDLGDNVLGSYGRSIRTSENENNYLAFDGEYFLDDNFISSIMFGARYTDSTQESRRLNKKSDYAIATDAHVKLRDVTPVSEIGELSPAPSDFNVGGITGFQYLDPREMQNPDLGIIYTDSYHTGSTWDLNEKVTDFYVQANFEQDFDYMVFRGNVGLRHSSQATITDNFSNQLSAKVPEELEKINNLEFDYRFKGDSDELLPSVNLILDVGDDYVFRAAYSTVISRPSFGQLAQPLNIKSLDPTDPDNDGSTRSVSKGNADLDAFKADKYDLSAEWYYNEGSSVSLGLFYYDVKTYVVTDISQQDLLGDGDLWQVKEPQNREGGSVQGFEASIVHQFDSLPAPFDGLGLQANYTYIDADTKEINPVTGGTLPLAGLSEGTYNAVLFYSKDQWDARISYNYRTEYYEQLQWDLPRFNEAIGRLSAKIKYKMDNGLSLYIQGSNLTDEVNTRYFGSTAQPFQTSEVGRNLVVGFIYRF